MELPWIRKLRESDEQYHETFEEIMSKIRELEKRNIKLPEEFYPSMAERIADLEVKMAKLWGLLIETNQYGKEKLTKHGRKFGGNISHAS